MRGTIPEERGVEWFRTGFLPTVGQDVEYGWDPYSIAWVQVRAALPGQRLGSIQHRLGAGACSIAWTKAVTCGVCYDCLCACCGERCNPSSIACVRSMCSLAFTEMRAVRAVQQRSACGFFRHGCHLRKGPQVSAAWSG
eukprot:1144466-Pelagomonas_calceolata.AAC.9